MPIHTLEYTAVPDSRSGASWSVSQEADAEEARDIVLSAYGSTTVALAFDKDNLKMIYVYSVNQMTLGFGLLGGGTKNIALKGGRPFVWHSDDQHANPFTADVIDLDVSNGLGWEVTLYVRVLHDSTP